MKRKQLTWAAAVAWLTCGCGGFGNWNYPTVRGNGDVATETRSVSGFDEVSVAGAGHLTVIQGDEESLAITVDTNLLAYIISEVNGDRLSIRPDNVNLRPTQTIEYVLKLKDLRALHLSGSLNADAESLQTDSLSVHISGSGSIRIPALETERIEANISGSGSGTFAGKATTLKLGVSGSGSYDAADLASQVADIRISGSGRATVWVSEQLDVQISGSGAVSYYGAPQAEQHVSGSGKLRALGAK